MSENKSSGLNRLAESPLAGVGLTAILSFVSWVISRFLPPLVGMDDELQLVAVVATVAGGIVATLVKNCAKRISAWLFAVVIGFGVFLLSLFGYLQIARDGSAGCDSLLCASNILLLCASGIFCSLSFLLVFAGVKWLSSEPSNGSGLGATADENSNGGNGG